jgi:prefoldin subunit 5
MSYQDDWTITDNAPINQYLAIPIPQSDTAMENALGAVTTLLDGWRYDTTTGDESHLSSWHEQHEAVWAKGLDLDGTFTSQIASLNSQITGLNADKAALTSQVSSLNAQITTLTADKAALQSQINSLNAQITTLNAQIASLNSQISSLNADKAALTSQVSSLNAQIATLTAIDYQLAVVNELSKTAFTFRAFKENCYNATGKVSSGTVTQVISNYRMATANYASLNVDGINLTLFGNVVLKSTVIGTQTVDFHAWIKITNAQTFTSILSMDSINIYYTLSKFSVISIQDSISNQQVVNTININEWNYFQITRVGTVVNVYKNGVLLISRTNVALISVGSVTVGYNTSYNTNMIINSPEIIIGGAAAQITTPPARE